MTLSALTAGVVAWVGAALASLCCLLPLTVIVLELPAALMLSVTVSLTLNVPVFWYACGLIGIVPALATLPVVTLPSPHTNL